MEEALRAALTSRGLPAWIAPDSLALVGLAGLVGGIAVMLAARRAREPLDRESRTLAVTFAAAWIGAALLELVWVLPQIVRTGHLPDGPEVDRNFYGSVLAGSAAAALYLGAWLRLPRASIAAFLDRSIWLWSSALVFTRLGCFLEGCCFGRVTSSALGVRFPPTSKVALAHAHAGWIPAGSWSLPVHPTQLYEAALGLVALAFALVVMRRRRRSSGSGFTAWLAVYALGRLLLEPLRASVIASPIDGLSRAQLISAILLVAAAAVAITARGPRTALADRA